MARKDPPRRPDPEADHILDPDEQGDWGVRNKDPNKKYAFADARFAGPGSVGWFEARGYEVVTHTDGGPRPATMSSRHAKKRDGEDVEWMGMTLMEISKEDHEKLVRGNAKKRQGTEWANAWENQNVAFQGAGKREGSFRANIQSRSNWMEYTQGNLL